MSKIGAKFKRQQKEQVAEIMSRLHSDSRLKLGKNYLIGNKLMRAVEKELSKSPVPEPESPDSYRKGLQELAQRIIEETSVPQEQTQLPSPAATRLKYLAYTGLFFITLWVLAILVASTQ